MSALGVLSALMVGAGVVVAASLSSRTSDRASDLAATDESTTSADRRRRDESFDYRGRIVGRRHRTELVADAPGVGFE